MKTLLFLVLAAVTLALRAGAAPPAAPRVAVFFEPGFPYYMASPRTSPKRIAANLEAAGVAADLLPAAALSDPARFDAAKYAALILPYGNVYPKEAFANLRVFHRAGGCLILSGVPFTHPVSRRTAADGTSDWRDEGNDDVPARFGPTGIGVGGFAGAPDAPVGLAPGDPLGLAALGRDWAKSGERLQIIDTAALPAGITTVPILSAGGKPVAALLVHESGDFKGAVDVWTHHPNTGDLDAYDSEQLLARGAVAALARKGLVSPAARDAAFAALARVPTPTVYAGLTLPTAPRPYPTFQPTMPTPTDRLYVADLRKRPTDERLLLGTLQGIVNRTKPRVYLLFGDPDALWLETLQKQGQTREPIRVADPLALVETFRREIKGAVVPDPKVYVSPNVAVNVAALDNAVVATPALAAKLKLPITTDLRGRFADDAAALRWVRTALLPKMNPYLAICLAPDVLSDGGIDQIVAAKGLCFWVTGSNEQGKPGAEQGAEQVEVELLLAAMPLNAVVRGFWWHGDGGGLGEGPGVSLGSRFGKVTIVSDFTTNYSVLSGYRVGKLKQKPQRPAPPLDRGKVYVALTMSDGDNLCTWRDYFRGYFEDPLHGTFPVGWGMGPTLIDNAPTVAKWFYDHATPNDEFLCDVSGVGYIYPPDWATALKDRDGALKAFYDWTATYLDRMDMKTIRLMGVQEADIAAVGRLLPGVAFLMPDYGFSGPTSYDRFTYTLPTGQPVFRAVTGDSGPQNLADQVKRRVGATRPAFVNAFIWNWGSKLADLKQMLDLLGPDYVPVTPSQLNTLYREAQKGVAVR